MMTQSGKATKPNRPIRFTKQETAFCRMVADGKSPAEAAKDAGYKKVGYGTRLLAKEKIRHAVERLSALEAREDTAKPKLAQHEEILTFLTSIMRGEETEETRTAQIRERMRAAELLGKRAKLFETEREQESPVIIIDDITGKGQ